jgi:uncharacterized protein YjbI with pentapeptide repeats
MSEPSEPAPPEPEAPPIQPIPAAPAARADRRTWIAGVALVLAALALGLGVHRSWQGRTRQALIRRVERSGKPLSRSELERAGRRFRGDRELLGASLLHARDPRASDVARLNALLLEAAVAPIPGGAGGPAPIGQLEWKDGQVRGAQLVDLTFSRGHFTAVTFADSTFAGVTWGAAFAGGRPGLFLSGVRFERCRFESSAFSGTHLARVEIVDSVFSGADLDLSNFDHVRFARSGPAALPAAIVRSDVVNHGQAPPAGVDDLAGPTEQVSFTGIAFESVHFRGWIRPEWFAGCTFTRCVLPTALRREALAAGHNTVNGCLWGGEPAD